MSAWRRWRDRLTGRADQDLDRELRAHLELEAEEQRESGLGRVCSRFDFGWGCGFVPACAPRGQG